MFSPFFSHWERRKTVVFRFWSKILSCCPSRFFLILFNGGNVYIKPLWLLYARTKYVNLCLAFIDRFLWKGWSVRLPGDICLEHCRVTLSLTNQNRCPVFSTNQEQNENRSTLGFPALFKNWALSFWPLNQRKGKVHLTILLINKLVRLENLLCVSPFFTIPAKA